ncbi:hypothetical protein PRIPAC_92633, partial [Pristionchus pacificus]
SPMSCAPVSPIPRISTEAKEHIERVLKMGEDSVNRGDRVTHCCISCRIEKPRQRVAATACGHAVCRECSHESKTCPECDTPTTFVSLIGDEDRRRECVICLVDQPYQRVFFTACGHSICTCCVLQLDEDNFRDEQPVDCPFCRCQSTVVVLVEEVIEAANLPAIQPEPTISQKKSSSRKRSRTNRHDSNTSNKRQRRA